MLSVMSGSFTDEYCAITCMSPFVSPFIHGWTFGLFPHLPAVSGVAMGSHSSLGLICRQTVVVHFL